MRKVLVGALPIRHGLTWLELRRDDEVMGTAAISPPSLDSKRGELMTRLFRDLQVARFNELYYQRRAHLFRFWATGANVISALAASAVLASLLASDNKLFGWGPIVWKMLTGVAAASAAIGPILGLEIKASQMEKAALGHSILKDRIRRLLSDLKGSDLHESFIARDKEIDAFASALAALDEAPSEKLREKCWNETLEEYPSEKAWTLV
jgi:hypothetical protein